MQFYPSNLKYQTACTVDQHDSCIKTNDRQKPWQFSRITGINEWVDLFRSISSHDG